MHAARKAELSANTFCRAVSVSEAAAALGSGNQSVVESHLLVVQNHWHVMQIEIGHDPERIVNKAVEKFWS